MKLKNNTVKSSKTVNNQGNKGSAAIKSDTGHDHTLFWKFVVQKQQIVDWAVCLLTCVVGFLFIRHCYPYPATFSDSFSYVAAAADNQFSIFRPFGYSAFLRFLHPISNSLGFVVVMQFVCYFISVSLLVLALKKYYPLKSYIRIPLEIIIVFSPAAIYMLNALMSDALFCCSIFVMLAMLLVVINDSSWKWVAALVYLVAFNCSLYLRYSAMFFPLAFIPVLLFVKPQWLKWSTIAMTAILFGVFYQNISNNMEKVVHTRQFSTGFDGWQLANNAMHVLPFIDQDELPENKKLVRLHRFSTDDRFDSLIVSSTDSGRIVGASFLWNAEFPLKQYLFLYMQEKRVSYPVGWAKLGGGLYSDYGKWLIMHYPGKFWKYYLSLNIRSGFYPYNVEMVGKYKEIPVGDRDIVRWFDVKEDQEMPAKSAIYEEKGTQLLPALDLIDWILMLAAVVVLFIFRKTSFSAREKVLSFVLIFAFGFIYYGSTIFASPIALRYWMPMHALKLGIVWMALSEVMQACKRVEATGNRQ